MTHIRIVDKPCGYGKSTDILNSYKKGEKYITVVPFLSEADRFVSKAFERSKFCMTQPKNSGGRKTDNCEKLIRDGKSVVCTRQLFYRLGTLATQCHQNAVQADFDGQLPPKIKTRHMLDDYNLIIDEVVDPFDHELTVKPEEFDNDYVALGMAVVHGDGRVEPTEKWDKRIEQGSRTFKPSLYEKAKSGALYKLSEGLFILTIPTELLTRPKTVTIYTYLSEGSVLLHFLHNLQRQHPGIFTLDVVRLDKNIEAEWRSDVASSLTVKTIPGLEKVAWNYTAQLKGLRTHKQCASVGNELRQFKESELAGVELGHVMLMILPH